LSLALASHNDTFCVVIFSILITGDCSLNPISRAYLYLNITPVGIASIAWRYYSTYAAMNFAFVPIIWYFYVETAKLSLEEINPLFKHKFKKGPQPQESSNYNDEGKCSSAAGEHVEKV
jgi:hypothetical protein